MNLFVIVSSLSQFGKYCEYQFDDDDDDDDDDDEQSFTELFE